MWWFLNQLQARSRITDPGKRQARRKKSQEPAALNPEFDFRDGPLPVATGDGDLNFGALPDSLKLARTEHYGAARTIVSWFWLVIVVVMLAPFFLLVLYFIFAIIFGFLSAAVSGW